MEWRRNGTGETRLWRKPQSTMDGTTGFWAISCIVDHHVSELILLEKSTDSVQSPLRESNREE